MGKEIFTFEIPGHSSRREWVIYVIVATHKVSAQRLLYVGKTGDNRAGCNPIVSRIGNHFSYNKIHSQLRNKMEEKKFITTDFNYKVFYTTFGAYDVESHQKGRKRINELERELIEIIYKTTKQLLNEPKRIGRKRLLSSSDFDTIKELADRVAI
ncbi:MAG TPA: hypothetical protein VK809_05320 [Bacteroidia bacterium]|jgi:hypothetical protein|nr:hypothetical protein [Bacteroidia bacterium]